jgi:hypothetical protein
MYNGKRVKKSLSDEDDTVSNNLKILFKNFFINSLKLGKSRGINYPNTCKVVTIMLL